MRTLEQILQKIKNLSIMSNVHCRKLPTINLITTLLLTIQFASYRVHVPSGNTKKMMF